MKYKFLLSLLFVLITSSFAFAQTQGKPGQADVFDAKLLTGNYAKVLWEKGLIQCSKTAPIKCAGSCCNSKQECQEVDLGLKIKPQYQFVCATTETTPTCKSNCGNGVCEVKKICNGTTCICAETPENCKQDCTKPAPK